MSNTNENERRQTMHKVEQAVEWLKKGGLVIVADDENRESEGDLIGIAEYATPESVNFMATYGRGLICASISQAIAEKLALPEMTANNTDAFGTAFTISVDHVTTSTGISAKDRAVTIEKLADPASQAADFYRPGHIFPLTAQPGGVQRTYRSGCGFSKACWQRGSSLHL